MHRIGINRGRVALRNGSQTSRRGGIAVPESPPPAITRTLDFRPSVNGFAFPNALSGPDVTVTVPLAGRLSIGDASNGVCGGMVFATCDYFEAGQPIPGGAVPPAAGSPLYTVITSRLIDSFNIPAGIAQYLRWMAAPDRSTGLLWWRRRGIGEMTVADQLPTVRATLDAGHPCPLGLVTVSGIDPRDLGANHVVLAYGYRLEDSGELTLRVYDPNSPGRDDIELSMNIATPAAGLPIRHNLGIAHPVRGFFAVTYSARVPATV